MNKEEAIKILQHYLEMEEFNNAGDFLIAIDIVLNLIQKQSKIIDKMAEQLTSPVHSKEWIIEFYKKEVEKDVED